MKKLYLFALSLLASGLMLPTLASANTTVSGTITTNTTWTVASSTFIVNGDVTVNPGVTLTINPGVVVKFNGLVSIINKGTLNAIGNATNTIYFTSYKDDTIAGDTNADGSATTPAAGNWTAVRTDTGGTSTIKFAELRYATNGYYNAGGSLTLATTTATTSSSYGIWGEKGTTTVTYSTISKNTTYGVFVGNTGATGSGSFSISTSTMKNNGGLSNTFGLYYRGKADLYMNGNSFATNTTAAAKVDYIDGGPGTFNHSANTAWGNGTNGIMIDNVASFGGDRTWMSDSIAYVLPDSASNVPSGKTLTISAGAVIKFIGVSGGLKSSGTINVQGSTSSPVYFTSYKDDAVGGDSNADGTSVPYGGDWQMLETPSGGTFTLDHAVVRYGGSSGVNQMIYVNAGTMTMTNSEVASSSRHGFTTANNGILSVSFSDIHDNGATTSTTYFGFKHDKGTTTIATSTIRNNFNYGLVSDIGSTGGNIYLYNNVFTNNGGGAAHIYLPLVLNFVHANNSATGTGKGGIVIDGAPGSDQTWYGDPLLPYIINSATGTITFSSVRNITIGGGAVFKFEGVGAGIFVNNGTLTGDSSGTTSKIYFTSIKDDTVGGDTNGNGSANNPAAGDWDTIKVGATLTLNNAVIRYGGNTAFPQSGKMLWNNSGTINLNNVEIATSSNYGIADENVFTTLNATSTTLHHNRYGYGYAGGVARIANRNNTIYSNSVYGISNSTATLLNAEQIYWPATTTGAVSNGPFSTTTNPNGHGDAVLPTFIDFDPWATLITAGNISTNTAWIASSTYVIDGTLTIDLGNTLTIASGTVVKFKTTTSGIVVNGVLIANSASSAYKDYFTSYKDDTAGGDTNADGSATSPAAGDWDGIKINNGGVASTSYAVFRYGGNSGGSTRILWNNGGQLDIVNTEISSSGSYGVFQSTGGTTTIADSDIHDNTFGACVTGGNLVIGSSAIHGNITYGVCNTTPDSIHAEHNFWGTSTGPTNASNPGGTGDVVSNLVTFNPFLTEIHYIWVDKLNHLGRIVSGVHSKTLKYASTTKYVYALWSSVAKWNVLGGAVGGVTISTTTATSTSDVMLNDVDIASAPFVAYYSPSHWDNLSVNDSLTLNDFYMRQYSSSTQQNTVMHELGHALGLYHSSLGNIMNSYVTSQITFGSQDISDYNYCWVGTNCQ